MAVASHHLWIDWRDSGLHLARLFTDYEPGIHWSQCQMQAGITGINTVRIYNPVKQGLDQDPEGLFIRKWLPELASLPSAQIHQPWSMPLLQCEPEDFRIGRDYPLPIINHLAAAQEARQKVWAVRQSEAFKATAIAIQERHGSRRVRRQKRTASRIIKQKQNNASDQLSLDLSLP